jgi:transcriptional regulator with XRE-family HTH domain
MGQVISERDAAIGKRIAQIRNHRLMTQGYLGEAIGVSRYAIYHFENGHRRITATVLELLAAALHCGVKDLVAPPEAPIPRIRVTRVRAAPMPRIRPKSWGGNATARPPDDQG